MSITQFRDRFCNDNYVLISHDSLNTYHIQTTTNLPFRVILNCEKGRLILSGIKDIGVDEKNLLLQFNTEDYLSNTYFTYKFTFKKYN